MRTTKEYYADLDNLGLNKTWDKILQSQDYFNPEEWPSRFEEGLAYTNKISKKEMGKYYTPIDVSSIMAEYFLPLKGDNICDVGCGVGNLILEVLSKMTKKEVHDLIVAGHLYLYDIDDIAINIAVHLIGREYGEELIPFINTITGDFLNENIILPANSKVISNPPYGAMKAPYKTAIQSQSKDWYSGFMEKIINQSETSVIITPHSYMGGTKYKILRELISQHTAKIISFDNVPGNIFAGRKLGVFNTNTANSVRAAITIIETKNAPSTSISEFIRFKTDERKEILNKQILDSLIDDPKVFKNGSIFLRLKKGAPSRWLSSSQTIKSLLVANSKWVVTIPKTCRYYTVGAVKNLNRSGKYVFYTKDEESFYLLYAMLNSSYAYYYYRITNGGTVFPVTLLKATPIPDITKVNFLELKRVVDEMISVEENYIILKKNSGAYQENIKFPSFYRVKLNTILSQAFGEEDYNFSYVHSNSFFSLEEEKNVMDGESDDED